MSFLDRAHVYCYMSHHSNSSPFLPLSLSLSLSLSPSPSLPPSLLSLSLPPSLPPPSDSLTPPDVDEEEMVDMDEYDAEVEAFKKKLEK